MIVNGEQLVEQISHLDVENVQRFEFNKEEFDRSNEIFDHYLTFEDDEVLIKKNIIEQPYHLVTANAKYEDAKHQEANN